MPPLFKRLWDDDAGAVISVELILLVAIIVFGLIPAFVALRNSMIASMATVGNTLTAIVPNFTYSGYGIIPNVAGGLPIAVVGGLAVSATSVQYLSGQQVAPTTATYVVVAPAP